MSILAACLTFAAFGLYVMATRLAWRSAASEVEAALEARPEARPGPWFRLILGGLLAHSLSLLAAMGLLEFPAIPNDLHFGFATALSATFLVGMTLLCFQALRSRLDALVAVILPVTALMALLPLFFPGSDLSAYASKPLFLPHLMVGTMAYGVLLLAAMHALLMLAAEAHLHQWDGAPENTSPSSGTARESRAMRHLFSRWLDRLPPLLVMERILFQFIFVGFVFLSLTALSGVVFAEQVFGRAPKLDHKTVFTLLSWAIFGALLFGRWRWGWRGRTALRVTVAGFAMLLLAYVGSRFVLEVVLQRA
jgi:ABC-type uncharacterized transport system permease subunit